MTDTKGKVVAVNGNMISVAFDGVLLQDGSRAARPLFP